MVLTTLGIKLQPVTKVSKTKNKLLGWDKAESIAIETNKACLL